MLKNTKQHLQGAPPRDDWRRIWCKTRTGGHFAKSRDLVITVKPAQFLTDRARSGTNRFRILPGVPNKKKLKTLNNICKTRTGGQFFAKSRDLVTVKT